MASASPTQGLLYAGSRIKSPPVVSPETYEKWYDDVHFRDLCDAGLTLALRYKNTNPKADVGGVEANEDVPWPYLALYKLHDLRWLTTDFLTVSTDSPLLPAEVGHDPFACFEVQLRSYEIVARSPVQPGTDRPRFVITFETPAPNPEKFQMMSKVYGALPGYRGSILYGLAPGLLEHEEKDTANKGFVVTWLDEMPKLEGPKHNAQVWELVREVGQKDATF